MITLEKLRIYQEFGGDIDGWARTRPAARRCGMSDGDWYAISELLQDLGLVLGGAASPAFAARVEERLQELAADDAARAALRRLAQAGS